MSGLDLLFPPRCIACGEPLAVAACLCASCEPTLLPPPEPGCALCAEPVAAPGETCARCTLEPPPFARVHVAFAFEGAMSEAIPRFKYRDRPHLAAPLAELSFPPLREALRRCDLIAPIPLHDSRLRERGFDQALLLARELARLAGKPVEPELLARVRATSHQVGQSRADRAENLAGAFTARACAGSRVAIVDDVVTTTSTARDAARALRGAGAAEVHVVALARAV